MNDLEVIVTCMVFLTFFVLGGLDRPNRWSMIRLLIDWALLTVLSFVSLSLIYAR